MKDLKDSLLNTCKPRFTKEAFKLRNKEDIVEDERGSQNPQISLASDPGTREYLLIFISFNTVVIYCVFISKSNKSTYKVVTPT